MAISQTTVTKSYGATEIQINVPFIAPPLPSNACKTSKPITAQAQVTVATTGGTIAGGQSLYYHLSAIDSLSQESIPSDPIEVIIPSGTNTNKVTISGPSPFDSNASLYNVYRSIGSPNGQGGTTSGTGPSQLFSNQTPPSSCAPLSVVDTGSNGLGGGSGDPTKMPVVQNLLKVRAYYRATGTSQWIFGGETLNGVASSVNFIVPHNIQGQQIDVQLRAVDNQLNETHSSIAPTYSYTIAAAYPAGLGVGGAPGANDGLIIGGQHVLNTSGFMDKSTPLNKQASIAGAGATSPFSYTSPTGGASVTWTWTAFSLPLPDGSTISVPASTSGTQVTVSGLTASTTYYFGIYYTIATGAVHIILSDVSSGTGKESLTQQVQTVNADGNIGIGVNVPATTGSSGGGSGGGGGGGSTCPAVAQLVETQERGFIPAGLVKRGMHLRGWHDDEWNEVLSVEIKPSTILAVKIAGEQFRVDANHKWLLFCEHEPTCEDCWIGSWELTLNTPLRGTDGNAHYAESISRIGKGEYAELNVETHRFRLGKVVGHNLVTNLQ